MDTSERVLELSRLVFESPDDGDRVARPASGRLPVQNHRARCSETERRRADSSSRDDLRRVGRVHQVRIVRADTIHTAASGAMGTPDGGRHALLRVGDLVIGGRLLRRGVDGRMQGVLRRGAVGPVARVDSVVRRAGARLRRRRRRVLDLSSAVRPRLRIRRRRRREVRVVGRVGARRGDGGATFGRQSVARDW